MFKSFRTWWQVPRKASEANPERTVSFLELFYDLVYVVAVAEIAHSLAHHIDVNHIGIFAFLFTIIWWCWLNGTSYHEFHGNNDIRSRVFTFLQMFAVGGMAVFAHNAIGDGATGFAIFYIIFQLIMAFLWWRTGVHDPNHSIISRPYVYTFLVSAVIFIISIVVPAPFRYYLWGIALLAQLTLPTIINLVGGEAIQQESTQLVKLSHAMVERFGLLTILVLAEVIVGVVTGLSGSDHLTWSVGFTAILGMLVAIGLWWLYFDFLSHTPPKASRTSVLVWMYSHLFLTMSITAIGASILYIVSHAGDGLEPTVRWLLVGAISVFLISFTIISQVVQRPAQLDQVNRNLTIITSIFAVVIALLGFLNISTIPLLLIIVGLMLIPVVYGMYVWATMLEAKDFRDAPH